MVEHPGLAAAICIAQLRRSMRRESSWELITVFVRPAFLEAMFCSLLLFILHPPPLPPTEIFSPTSSSLSEQGKEWVPQIESARTLLSLFGLQKHAHVTLTFFIFNTELEGENVQTRSHIWYTIVYRHSAFIFILPELLGRLTKKKRRLTARDKTTWKPKIQLCVICWRSCFYHSTICTN